MSNLRISVSYVGRTTSDLDSSDDSKWYAAKVVDVISRETPEGNKYVALKFKLDENMYHWEKFFYEHHDLEIQESDLLRLKKLNTELGLEEENEYIMPHSFYEIPIFIFLARGWQYNFAITEFKKFDHDFLKFKIMSR